MQSDIGGPTTPHFHGRVCYGLGVPTNRDTLNSVAMEMLNAVAMGRIGPLIRILVDGRAPLEVFFSRPGAAMDPAHLVLAADAVAVLHADAIVVCDEFAADASSGDSGLAGVSGAMSVGVASEADFSGWFATDITGLFERPPDGLGRPRPDLVERWSRGRAERGLPNAADALGPLLGSALGRAAQGRDAPPDYATLARSIISLLRAGGQARVDADLTEAMQADPTSAAILASLR